MSDSEETGALEVAEDAGKPPSGVVRRWIIELGLASKEEKDWRKNVKRIESKYRGDNKSIVDGKPIGDDFNILWSNTETLAPALYNSTPTPDVRRRFRDEDKIGKAASQLLERSLDYSIDAYDFDDVMQDAIHDVLIAGRAVARVRYLPSIKTVNTEQIDGSNEPGSYETLETEQVICELVPWEDYRHGPGKRWRDVSWHAFRSWLNRAELIDKFGNLGKTIELVDVEMGDEQKDADERDKDAFKRLPVWEIWDKDKLQVVFIAETHKDRPLKIEPDPMGLDGFFPIPRPMYSIRSTKSLVPIPEYTLYEEQARELDRVSGRINRLIQAIKFRGIYDSTLSEIERLFNEDENTFIPAKNVTALIERGGLEKAIWTLPIEMAAEVLKTLYITRDQIKQTIYEITGISDILRGNTNPNETATAQGIKNQWGALRLQRRQAEVQRFARDILRIKAEIIAEKFLPETVLGMANLSFPSQVEKQQAEMAMQQSQVAQQSPPLPGQPPAPPPPPPDPKLIELLEKPTVEEVFSFLKDNAHRQFRIDIETDSTIAAIIAQDQKNLTELMTGMSVFMQSVAPAVQAGALPLGAAKAIMLSAVRRFKLGAEVEDELDKMPEQLPDKGDAEGKEKAMKAEMDAAKAGMDAEKKGMESEMQARDGEMKLKELGMQIQEKAMKLDQREMELGMKEQGIGLKEQGLGIKEQGIGLKDQMAGQKENELGERETGIKEAEVSIEQVQQLVMNGQAQMMQAMEAKMNDFITMIAKQDKQEMMQIVSMLAGSLSAPKRIVRDSQGRAQGVETVQ